MKMQTALDIINGVKKTGYMIHFERIEGKLLHAYYFPDKPAGEELIYDEEEAWELATRFAAQTIGECVNIYVIDNQFRPVSGYMKRKIKNRT